MGTKVNNNYEDLLTFTRASKGHALRPVSYGTELVTNGTFNSDLSGWTVDDANGTIAWDASEAISLTGGAGTVTASQSFSTTAGGVYQITITGPATGNIHFAFDGPTTPPALYAAVTGDRTFYVVASESTMSVILTEFAGSGPTLVDNVSVKEVLFDQPDGTLTLFEHPENVPRVEWDADRNRLGLLVEEARTNLFTESEELSSKGHSMNIDDNVAIAPDRTQTASFCKPDTSSSEHYIDDANVTSGTDYAISCFAKQGPGDYLLAFRGSGIGVNPPRFNLATGTIDNTGSSDWSDVKIQEIGNGWYRCSAVANPNSTTPLRFQMARSDGVSSFAGDGTSGLYIWGCQIEQASFPTSYIKTTGGTATRSADVASIPVADFGYNQSAGTVFVEAKATGDALSFPRFVNFQDDPSNRWELIGDTALDVRMFQRFNATTDVNTDILVNVLDGETSIKLAYAKAENDAAGAGNGNSVVTDASNGQLSGVTTLYIGAGSNGSSDLLNGHIKSIKYYPRRLTNAQLVELTS